MAEIEKNEFNNLVYSKINNIKNITKNWNRTWEYLSQFWKEPTNQLDNILKNYLV